MENISRSTIIEPGTEWTAEQGVCQCGELEEGYAKKDANGTWHSACWSCVKPENSSIPIKRNKVGSASESTLEPESDSIAQIAPAISLAPRKKQLTTEPKESTLQSWSWKRN